MRYIDADKLEGYLKRNADILFKSDFEIKMFLNEFYAIPTEDVVPRAEVEKSKREIDMEIITEFKELVKQYLLDRFILPVFVKNALAHAETELKKKYIGE